MDAFDRYGRQFVDYLPNLLTAALLIIAAFLVAAIARWALTRGLQAARVDERLAHGHTGDRRIVKPAGDIVYYLVLLLFVPGILAALGLSSMLRPVQELVSGILEALPRILGAALILVIGFFVARILRTLVTSITSAAGVDRASERLNLGPNARFSNLLGIIVYALVIIPVITAALDALQLDAITGPISDMLRKILAALPHILAAIAVVIVAFFVGGVVAGIVSGLLANVGFDRLLMRLGLTRTSGTLPPTYTAAGATPGKTVTASDVVGHLVHGAIVLFAVMAALDLLGASQLENLVRNFLVLIGQILLGLVIFAVGVWVSNLLASFIAGSSMGGSKLLIGLARGATLALFGAMALRQMGIANEIVNLAFGLTLGALAVAFALAFGLGGREAAGKIAERWRQSLEGRAGGSDTPPPPRTGL
ncbi:putative membrane protein YwzB [Deinobacterium chartae]|uniref:Putative membrane protein YwzB n=1 Tax=Deinobacterium chartae TaxID=521158 RepID=A0A841I0M0_9DEIO|nr:putative membrane protein YwzB [Deinobacterium chartae]